MRLIKSFITFCVLLLLLVVGITFTLRNQMQVPLDLVFYQLPENSLALWLVLSLIGGALLGLFLALPLLTHCKARCIQLEHQLKQQKKETHQLRTLGIKNSDP